jgi:coenzyme F420-reducing hydrogenase beta subunit
MIDKIISRVDCMGCKMCGDICPKKAVDFEIDNEGFWYPTVHYEKCVNCNLCVKHCPVLNETVDKKAHTPEVYSAYAKDEEIRLKSTSGGIYYPFARTVLNENGYIAGCAFANNWKSAAHIVGNTQADLDKIYRSKYFQSDTGGIYKQIKTLLDADETVLFCGAPCQSAALLEYCGKKYDNLIRVDFICRGANSPKAHAANCRELEKKHHSKITFFNFKNKTKGWQSLGVFVKFENGETDLTFGGWRGDNAYILAYNESYANFCMRPSCENCRFKKIPRVSDITIGDFWGIQGKSQDDMFKGISVVMVNTEKGARFYEKTLPLLYSEKRCFDEVLKGNSNLAVCAKYASTDRRAEFFRRIETEDFSKVVWEFLALTPFKIWSRKFTKLIRAAKKRLRL